MPLPPEPPEPLLVPVPVPDPVVPDPLVPELLVPLPEPLEVEPLEVELLEAELLLPEPLVLEPLVLGPAEALLLLPLVLEWLLRCSEPPLLDLVDTMREREPCPLTLAADRLEGLGPDAELGEDSLPLASMVRLAAR